MPLSSGSAEILLQTSAPLGDGVARPQTQRDLRVIQELRKQHSFDYDSHGNCRFVEWRRSDTPP